jgi:CheY-like chemotaxis protein
MSVHEQTVLLVEDNPDDALLTRRAFTKAGIPKLLQVVEDGERAVAYLAGNGDFADRDRFPLPLLVLLDLKLPRRSGFEVLEWLRVQPGLRRLPVVVLTSSDQSADVNRAFDLGANSYLVKPVKFDALLDMVKALNLYWLLLNEKPELQTS